MNRRQFQYVALNLMGAGALGFIPLKQAAAHVTTDVRTQQPYRYRLRYQRQGRIFSLWMRVSDPKNLDDDVPLVVNLSTDQAGLNVVSSTKYVARALDSHMLKPSVRVSSTQWSPGQPLYCQLHIGAAKTPSRAWIFAPTSRIVS